VLCDAYAHRAVPEFIDAFIGVGVVAGILIFLDFVEGAGHATPHF
jgi:hypothetical protein